MPQHFIISEYGSIRRGSDYPLSERVNTLSDIFVSESTFAFLKQLTFKANADSVLSFTIQKSRECIRIKKQVGLLETSDGTQIEILPKVVRNDNPVQARMCLLKMLRYVPDLPFHTLTQAHLHHANLPLWEVFISAFIAEMEKLTRQGIQKSYITIEDNQPFLRGKWLLNRQNHAHPETLYVAHDEFSAAILPNQLLKTCLLFLVKRSRHLPNQTRLRQLRFAWDEVTVSENIDADFEKSKGLMRNFKRYEKALQWAKVLLQQQSWATSGKEANDSLLFPTERLFENYVAKGFKAYLTDFDVVYQDTLHYLIDDHAGKKQFNLRPDLVLRKGNRTIVLDMKWKWIEPNAPKQSIEQADLYQLYAYGQKYNADALFLIYPAHESFQTPLPPFRYDEQLTLTAIPFNITNSLANEMAKIKTFLE
ncbi:McrC family protein [Runella sp.]|jgi:5-methylcytosine-specific restriction enzyme subunit McrC|uniref:McrC family protein n=1 Tax=Runella sp. TaxID=1960881 RepID=UPI0026199AC6|nr:McrC family protein [Runella sp.]